MIVKKTDEDNVWSILSDDKVIARIEQYKNWNGKNGAKTLYVGSRKICQVDNQKDALEKLEVFFVQNKEEIKKVETLIGELATGITEVSHQVSIDALGKEKSILESSLKELKSYDLRPSEKSSTTQN